MREVDFPTRRFSNAMPMMKLRGQVVAHPLPHEACFLSVFVHIMFYNLSYSLPCSHRRPRKPCILFSCVCPEYKLILTAELPLKNSLTYKEGLRPTPNIGWRTRVYICAVTPDKKSACLVSNSYLQARRDIGQILPWAGIMFGFSLSRTFRTFP